MNANIDRLAEVYGAVLQDTIRNRFICINTQERQNFIQAIRSAPNNYITCDILINTDEIMRSIPNIQTHKAVEYAVYFSYFQWIENQIRMPIEGYDPDVPIAYINEVYNLFNVRPQQIQPARQYQQPYGGHQQPGMSVGSYPVGGVHRTTPQVNQSNIGVRSGATTWTQAPSRTQAPYQNQMEPQPVHNPIPEVTSKLVQLTSHSVTFSMTTIDKEGNEVNKSEHDKFHEEVMEAKNRDSSALTVPTVVINEASTEEEEQLRLENSLIKPKGSQLVEAIIISQDSEDDAREIMSCTKARFTSLDREVLTSLSNQNEPYLYTDIAEVVKSIRVLNSKSLSTVARALEAATVINIDTILNGILDKNVVHPIDVVFIRDEIITSINNTLGSVLGLTPTSYCKSLSEFTPKDSSTDMLSILTKAIKKKSTSPVIEYLDIPAELNRAVTRVLGKISTSDNDIELSRIIGVGYISRNLEDLKFGASIAKQGYITTSMDSLQEITDIVRDAIATHGEYHLLTKDGYMLALTTSAVPTKRNNRDDDPSGGLLFARIDGINAVNMRLADIAEAIM